MKSMNIGGACETCVNEIEMEYDGETTRESIETVAK
jgi:hypothetical protein